MTDFTLTDSLKKRVIIRSPLQLGGVIDSTIAYVPDGIIDMGAIQITIPNDGITIVGIAQNISGLISSENNYTMFIDGGGGVNYSGNVFLSRMTITTSGTSSKPFDLDNNGNGGAVELVDFSFLNCSDLGELTAYRQGLTLNFATIRCTGGFTLSGTWAGGFAPLTSIIVSAGVNFTGTFLKEGTNLVINGSIRSDMNALQIHSTGEFCDFQPSNITNDAEFLMNGVRVNPDSTAFPNMPPTTVKALFTNCVGTPNTYVGGSMTITVSDVTSGITQNVLTPLVGTGVWNSDLTWFQAYGDNSLEYISHQPSVCEVTGTLSFSGTNNKEMALQIRHYIKSSDTTVNIGDEFQATLNGGASGTRAENLPFGGNITFNYQDRLEIYEKNKDGTQNITTSIGGIILVKPR